MGQTVTGNGAHYIRSYSTYNGIVNICPETVGE